MVTREERRAAVLDLVLELAVLVEEDMTSGLARDGLTKARAHLLFEVVQRGPSTQQVLAGALGVAPRTVTGLVDGLVATGFVTREPHPRDRRAALVTLTAHGHEVAGRLVAGRGQFAEALLGDLSPARLEAVADALGEVVGRMRGLVEAARPDDVQAGDVRADDVQADDPRGADGRAGADGRTPPDTDTDTDTAIEEDA